jgi:hypothetical protein
MNPLILRYVERLGDIVALLQLTETVHDVVVECHARYAHGLREVYADRVRPLSDVPADNVSVMDLTIWPHRYEEFRRSGKHWRNFVLPPDVLDRLADMEPCARPELHMTPREVLEDRYGPEALRLLCCVTGHSQAVRWRPAAVGNAMIRRGILHRGDRASALCEPEHVNFLRESGFLPLVAHSYRDLFALVYDAERLVTNNSAPNIIAGTVRHPCGRRWWWYSEGDAQTDHRWSSQNLFTPI